jgi:hypothetical protein
MRDLMCEDSPMRRLIVEIFSVLIVGTVYWQLFCQMTGALEPWDAPIYWSVGYPVSLVLSAIIGRFLGADGWLGGALVTLVQFPLMWLNNGIGPLWGVGLIFLIGLAIPCAAISALTGRFSMLGRTP